MEQFEGQFVIEYFKQVRGELTTRVQIHTNLVLQKVATCGAALGFMFNQKIIDSESLVPPDVQLLGFALIPIIAMGYDVLIARNINSLHRLGTFIRNELEPLAPSMRSNLWETKYGQPDTSKPKNHGVAEINFLSLFTLATEITATAIYLNKQPSYLLIIAALFLLHIFVFLYMKQQILQFDTFENEKS
jgi:hypothetical protein